MKAVWTRGCLVFLVILGGGLFLRFPLMDSFIWAFTLLTVYVFLFNLTRRINFLDVTALAACLAYLLMPLITYSMYGEHNKMASLWLTYMHVEKEKYFLLALPGTVALIIGLWMPPWTKVAASDVQLVENVKQYLRGKRHVGLLLVFIGLAAVPFVQWAPTSIRAIFFFVSQLTYIGFIYLLHSNLSYKGLAIGIIIFLLLAQTIITGMYGELVYWSVMGVILLLMGRTSFTMSLKLLVLGLGIISLFLIQSIKHEYRENVWDGAERRNDPALFLSLIGERVLNPASIFDPERVYRVVVRANQGFLVARTMDYVPKHEPFAGGETIFRSFAAAIAPRFVWPDKPEVGGRANICRFLGDCGRYHYSYNIGQLGEGYVNFGIYGAWIFMFAYGFMINNLFQVFRRLSTTYPTLLLWTPMLFYAALVVETDVLTFINSFVKGSLFCAFCFLAFRLFLRIRL